MALERKASSSQLAAALGLRPATVQTYARNGRIPFDTTPGGHRRFNIDEVRAALGQVSAPQTPPPTRFRGTRGWLVDALELEGWAERLVARDELPGLIRNLVIGSTNELRSVDFRAGEGIGMTGWDGQADAVHGNAWVPGGKSVWEMGTNEDVTTKADADYAARTDDPQGVLPSEATFIFVSPRRWPQRDDWAATKRGEKIWKDVRAYDADTLEAWLDSTPAVHVRVTKMLGRDPDGASDLSAAWNRWSLAALPPVPPGLVTAGRESEAESLIAWLQGEPSVMTIQAESPEESFAFVAATILSLPQDAQEVVTQRTLAVHSPEAWDEVIARVSSDTRLLLIPTFSQPSAIEASDIGHQVAIPVDLNTPTSGARISLPRIKRQPAAEALISEGVPEQQAHELAGIARRSLLMFRRRVSANASSTPPWATPENADEIVPLVLAGAWQEGADGDEQFLSEVCSKPYADVSAACTRWSGQSDMPVRRESTQWFCVSKRDSWELVARFATASNLANFRTAAVKMLTTIDPSLSLEVDKRWAAGLYDRSLPWSSNLMTSVVESLALIATSTGDTIFPNGMNGQRFADSVVREVLGQATADESKRLWPSLDYALPLLAEASPDVFLEMVDRALDQGSLLSVFDPEAEKTIFSHPRHTGLLWSLEALAWAPEHLGSAAVILALLAEREPGGRWSNRPAGSLKEIFQPFHPQTAASFDERYSVLDAIREVAPRAAWDMMVSLLPTRHFMAQMTYSPRWREWQPEDEPIGLTGPEIIRHCRELARRLLEDVRAYQAGWTSLIKALPELPDEQFDAILACVSSLDISSLESGSLDAMIREFRELVQQHRKYATAVWALPEEKVLRIEKEFDRFTSEDPTEAFVSMFSYRPSVPGLDVSDSNYLTAVREKQEEAARSIVSDLGFDGILNLASKCKAPHLLGAAVGAVSADFDEEMLGRLESDKEAEQRVAFSYVNSRFFKEGWPWVSGLSENFTAWPSRRVVHFLLALPPESATFTFAGQCGGEVKKAYWSGFNEYHVESDSDRREAVESLLAFGLFEKAISLFWIMKEKGEDFDTDVMLDTLRRTSFSSTASESISNLIYEVKELLVHARGVSGVNRQLLAHVEWKFLPVLKDGQHETSLILHEELSANPSFFVDLIALIYPRQDSENSEIKVTGEMRNKANQAYALLKSWKGAPRLDGDGEGPVLAAWVSEVRTLLLEKKLLRYGDTFIGEVLFHASRSLTEWPPLQVRQIIENVRSQNIENGFAIAVMNSRGATWRSLDAGGGQERALADKYQQFAQDIGNRWPRTQRLLRKISEHWDQRARQEDHMAEIREDFWS
ncbi:hypothetical protein GXW83_09720 [Streptacidiphilus sp. PB12-B1b]|uniref:hypothetical protein n=1 Tax=Streptacidiphilus sp. PB12-B1b TaxID=2705012 RepID=UPI0015F98E68|nr:hypothetical protein [Streptacidiphilus sp. PB12-B1b]QMU75973.1 hypothetical protein GXW83_09720 [Streptacidiphilus sp. PB12-B1b]